MAGSIEDRLAHLEDTVERLEQAAAEEQARRVTGRRVRLAVLVALAAFYAWYLHSVTGTLGGL